MIIPFLVVPCAADESDKPAGRLYGSNTDKSAWEPHPVPGPPKLIPLEPALPPSPEGMSWEQTFVEEFDSPILDPKKWRVFDSYARKGGFWLKRNVRVENGNLVISVNRENDPKTGELIKTAGGIESRGRFEQRFGYFVCRYKMLKQNGSGYHCSFWLQSPGAGTATGDGRNGTEIDIIEKFKTDDIIQHCLHWDGYGEDHKRTKFSFPWPGIKQGFHTFGLVWTSEEYVFYVDGVETWRTDAGGVSQVPAFLRLTLEFSEGWNGKIAEAELPDDFVVDWVKVYKASPAE